MDTLMECLGVTVEFPWVGDTSRLITLNTSINVIVYIKGRKIKMIQLYKNMLDDDLIKELLDYYQHNLDRLTDYGNFEQVEIDVGHKLSNLMKDLTHKIGDDYFERHDKTGMDYIKTYVS